MALTRIRKHQVNGLVEELNKIKEQIKTYREPVALLSDLPIQNNNEGDIRVCLEDKNIYVWSDNQWHINTVKGTFSRTLFLTIDINDQTAINTGIRFDDQGDLRTNSDVINLYLNGVLVDKNNYIVENINEEMVINWLSTEVLLEENDLIAIQFYDITGGLKLDLGNNNIPDVDVPVEDSDVIIVGKAILPKVTKTVDIGSEDLRFRSIYVDEAYLDANTLYIDGVPVLGTQADNIVVKADPDQSITVKTSGVGSTKVSSESNVEMSTNTLGANIDIKAQATSSKVNVSAAESINLSGQTINIAGVTTLSDAYTNNLTVKGKLVMQGRVTEIQSENMTVKDNIIEINKGEVGNGVSAGTAGIKVDRGDELPYMILFDEADDMFKVGQQGNLENIASHEWVAEQIKNISGDTTIIMPDGSEFLDVEYGQFKLSVATGELNIGDIVPYDTVVAGNMTINNGRVKLKAGKTYDIEGTMFIQYNGNDGRSTSWLYDVTNNVAIGTGSSCYATSTASYMRGNNSCARAIITPVRDIEIALKINNNYGASIKTVNENISTLVVKEIARPISMGGNSDSSNVDLTEVNTKIDSNAKNISKINDNIDEINDSLIVTNNIVTTLSDKVNALPAKFAIDVENIDNKLLITYNDGITKEISSRSNIGLEKSEW